MSKSKYEIDFLPPVSLTGCHHVWDVQTASIPESGAPTPATFTCAHCGETHQVVVVFRFHES